jgi:hypothetical protein
MPLIIANTFIKIKAVSLNFPKKKQVRKSIMNQKGMMLQMAKKMKSKWLAPIWPHERVKTKENGSTKPFSDVTSNATLPLKTTLLGNRLQPMVLAVADTIFVQGFTLTIQQQSAPIQI